MNREFDELVHDSMKSFTDGIEVPAGLAAKARHHHRQQRRTKIGWLAAGTAVAGATAVLVTTTAAGQVSPTRPSTGQTIKAQTTAQVLSYVDRAIAKTKTTEPVQYVRETSWGVRLPVIVLEPLHPTVVRVKSISTWSRGRQERVENLASSGRLVLGAKTTTAPKMSTSIWIDYSHRIWWRVSLPVGNPGPSCFPNVPNWTPAQWASEVTKLLSCSTVTKQGRQQVDGIDAIRLKIHTKLVRGCVMELPQVRGRETVDISKCHHFEWMHAGWNGNLWLDPSTYLPVRLTSFGPGRSGQRFDFQWLSPTPANLAKLRQPIPAGFRHV